MIEYTNVNGFKGTPERLIQATMQEELRTVVSMASASQVVCSASSNPSVVEDDEGLDVEDDDLEIETDIPQSPLVLEDDVDAACADVDAAAASADALDDLDREIESIKRREEATAV